MEKISEFSNPQPLAEKWPFLIIGKGLFGSAAARHLARTGKRVCLVGPDEPADWTSHIGVFSSHYDEARIVSQSAPDEILQALDHASIAAYPEIAEESGISFFSPTGRLSALPKSEPVYYPYLSSDQADCSAVSQEEVKNKYPFCFPSDYAVVFEEAPSGYLNPRAMVKAQTQTAQKHGAHIVSALVTGINACGSHVEATLADGRILAADKVLIATGAFGNCLGLLKQKLAIRAESIDSVLCEVSAETASKFAHLPPLNYRPVNSPITHISVLPPLPYPDGKPYIKLALNSLADTLLPTFEAMSGWFRHPTAFPYLEEIKQVMAHLLPSIKILS